jgi:hypothetical protein
MVGVCFDFSHQEIPDASARGREAETLGFGLVRWSIVKFAVTEVNDLALVFFEFARG